MIIKLINTLIILLLVFITALIVNKITKTKKLKILLFIVIILSLTIITSLSTTSLINYFSNFETPEDAFDFLHSEKIVDIIKGDESCMIIYKTDDNVLSWDYVLKSEDKYKIPYDFSSKQVFQSLSEKGNFSIYNIKGSNDYYITGIIVTENDNLTIVNSDNINVNYIIANEIIVDNKKQKTIYIYDTIKKSINDYYLIINDEKIIFQ